MVICHMLWLLSQTIFNSADGQKILYLNMITALIQQRILIDDHSEFMITGKMPKAEKV